MTQVKAKPPQDRFYGLSPQFDALVHRIIATLEREKLTNLRKDFHTRLRISQAIPDRPGIVEDLWDFFYDWCVFEQRLPDGMAALTQEEKALWKTLKTLSSRGVFNVQKISEEYVKIKELYNGKTICVPVSKAGEFFGICKGDLVECRILAPAPEDGAKLFSLVRRPSYHPLEVHDYIKKKVRQFKRAQDFSTYQNWLWLVVGMYLKHRIYTHMPIEKIYDDNSRI